MKIWFDADNGPPGGKGFQLDMGIRHLFGGQMEGVECQGPVCVSGQQSAPPGPVGLVVPAVPPEQGLGITDTPAGPGPAQEIIGGAVFKGIRIVEKMEGDSRGSARGIGDTSGSRYGGIDEPDLVFDHVLLVDEREGRQVVGTYGSRIDPSLSAKITVIGNVGARVTEEGGKLGPIEFFQGCGRPPLDLFQFLQMAHPFGTHGLQQGAGEKAVHSMVQWVMSKGKVDIQYHNRFPCDFPLSCSVSMETEFFSDF